jgi:hypothetical protein
MTGQIVGILCRVFVGLLLGAAAGMLYCGLVSAVHVGVYGRFDHFSGFAVGCMMVGGLLGLLGGGAWTLTLRPPGLSVAKTGARAGAETGGHKVDRSPMFKWANSEASASKIATLRSANTDRDMGAIEIYPVPQQNRTAREQLERHLPLCRCRQRGGSSMHSNTATHSQIETVAAALTEAAYPVALRHGTMASWVDLELELWKVLSETLQRMGQGLFRAPADARSQRDGRRAAPVSAKPMFERLVTYFGLDEADAPTSRRFLSYKIIAGPGPSEDAGLASIITLALSDQRERCGYCQNVHTVEKGGAEAAMAAAIHYLDAYHSGERLRKVESDVRI